jgi:hypothetical protein
MPAFRAFRAATACFLLRRLIQCHVEISSAECGRRKDLSFMWNRAPDSFHKTLSFGLFRYFFIGPANLWAYRVYRPNAWLEPSSTSSA